MDAHIQRFNCGAWQDAAVITVQQSEMVGSGGVCFIEYELNYVFRSTAPPISLAFPVTAEIGRLNNWPAFLYDLVPQGNGRKFLLGKLGLADNAGADFALICAGAFNPVGCLRVKEAVLYYADHVKQHPAPNMDHGVPISDIQQRTDQFIEKMMVHGMLAAGSTGLQGAAPKFMLAQDSQGLWHADGRLQDDLAVAHAIVKFPRGASEADRKVLRNEAAYMRVAQALGLRVHGEVVWENNMLMLPRFDRHVEAGRIQRIHQESLASLAGIVGFDQRPTQFQLLAALRRYAQDPTLETIEFLKRDVLNLAMRNTDNHARNTAIQVVDGAVQLTPLYDFAPMYLDPEGIARACRWYHPETKIEINEWADVIEAMEIPADENERVKKALKQFGEQIKTLHSLMLDCGVDHDIAGYLKPAIETQIDQLTGLRLAPEKHHR